MLYYIHNEGKTGAKNPSGWGWPPNWTALKLVDVRAIALTIWACDAEASVADL